MHRLSRALWSEMHVGDDRLGQLLAPHVMQTGIGEWWVGTWPRPRASCLFVGGNLALQGTWTQPDVDFLSGLLREKLRSWDRIFLEMASELEASVLPSLRPLQYWPRVVLHLASSGSRTSVETKEFHRLDVADTPALASLCEELHWVGDSWGGLEALAQSGRAWGAWCDGTLASIAAPGLVGAAVEDVFVGTEPAFRGRGLSPRCAQAVIADIVARGKTATWTTWPANSSSLRVAEKLGFREVHEDHAWIAGHPL